MLPKMQYRLGLDLGTTSIGWCLVRLNKDRQPIAIIKMGARIFSDGRNPKDGTSLAVTRREARQARRRRDRLLKRKARMMDALIEYGFFPDNKKERESLLNLNPYMLRKKGLYEALTGAEFARALFHINQRRGFLSNRKTDKTDNESGTLKRAIKELREKLQQENCQTLGEWLANRHEKGKSVRARLRGKTQKDKAYDFYADRSMVEHEFDTLWEKQAQFNKTLFNETARNALKDILLFQRPLKPVKPGRCTLLPDEERAPKALPSAQKFRIYQEVNNLRFLNNEMQEESLTLEQRNKVVALLEHGDATFKTKINKVLGMPGTTKYNLQDIKRDRLKGNQTTKILSKDNCFGKVWFDFSLEFQDKVVDKLLHEESLDKLLSWLQKETDVDEKTAENIADTHLPEGYGSLSKKALDRILPELKKNVVVYSSAVERAGFESHSALSHAQKTGEIMELLPYYGIPLSRHVAFGSGDVSDSDEKRYGKIANPTVHIGLNEVRKVVNGLIKRYGHPSEVIVEVARDLKLSRERKNKLEKEQKERQDRNRRLVKKACQVLNLDPENLDKSKRREISQKMQLWEELSADPAQRCCPYTGQPISISRLLSNEVEIEHILPYSRTLDNSMSNKTVSMRQANRDKGNQTPYEAFGNSGLPDYNYAQILQRAELMPKAKGRRFAKDGYENWLRDNKDFLVRALNDTAYLSRITKEYLSLICPPNNVRAIPGRMTALLRGRFGLNNILSEDGIKNRNDHRHHAVDAAVIAVTDQGLLQRFSKASAYAKTHHLDRLVDDMPMPWPNYRAHVLRGVDNIIVSHKPDHGYQGSMHEDTAWGIQKDKTSVHRVLSDDADLRIRKIKNEKLTENLVQINSTNNLKRHGVDDNGLPNKYKGYVGGSNYCIEIYCNEKDKWCGEVISTYHAYQIIRKMGEVEGYQQLRHPQFTQSGHQLVMRLMNNDMVKMDVEGDRKIMRIVKIGGNGQIFFAEHNEANVDARNRDKEDSFVYVSKTAGALQKTQARMVTVSEIGHVREYNIRE